MKLLIVLLLSVVTVHSKEIFLNKSFRSRNPSGYMFGGEDTDIADVPWQISLQYVDFGHLCGAVIVSDQWGITAGNCLYHYDISVLYIRAGSSHHSSGGTDYTLAEKHAHPEFEFQSRPLFNVGVFRINGVFDGNFMTKIALADSLPPVGTQLLASGWNRLMTWDDSQILQSVYIPIVDSVSCNISANGELTEIQFCAGEIDRHICTTDSGSPAVANNKLVGINVGCTEFFTGWLGILIDLSFPSVRSFIIQYIDV